VVGRLVRRSEEAGVPLAELDDGVFAEEHPAFEGGVGQLFDWEASVESRDTRGGTSRRAVEDQLARVREALG
jgi:argininosuccinate lyase